MPKLIPVGLLLLALAATSARAAEPPKVLTSIKPLHALAAGIMAGAGEPALLMRAAASAHTYTLRPSDVRAIDQAKLLFWIGPGYEAAMAKAVEASARKTQVVEMGRLPDIRLLSVREGGVWDDHDAAGHDHRHGTGQASEHDMHIWLDPENAKAIVRAMAASLIQADPANGALYRDNAAKLADRLDRLDAELRATLEPVAAKPYVVFHDAYQYFEQRYGLHPVGSITVTPDRVPGPRRLSELRRAIGQRNAACVFSEPQFTSSLVETVAGGTRARTGTLDALGATAPVGTEGYFVMMKTLAANLAACLGQAG